jgi:hypothetical protein
VRKTEKPKPEAPPPDGETPPGPGLGPWVAETPDADRAALWASCEARADSRPSREAIAAEATLKGMTERGPLGRPATPDPAPREPEEPLEGRAPPGLPVPPPVSKLWIGGELVVAPRVGMVDADPPPPLISLSAGNGGLGARPLTFGMEPDGRRGDEEKPKGRGAPSPFDPVCVTAVTPCVARSLTGATIFPAACVTGAIACVAALVTGATIFPAACVTGAIACVAALVTGATIFPAACVTGAIACVAALVTGVTTLPAAGVAGAMAWVAAPVTGAGTLPAACVAESAVCVTAPLTVSGAPAARPRALA